MTRLIARGCPQCGGDLYPDGEPEDLKEWACLQCGRRMYPSRSIDGYSTLLGQSYAEVHEQAEAEPRQHGHRKAANREESPVLYKFQPAPRDATGNARGRRQASPHHGRSAR